MLDKHLSVGATAQNENRLIATLPRKVRKQFLLHCTPVHLSLAEVLVDQGAVSTRIYFPLDGFVSLVTHGKGSPPLEVGMVGNEGAVGVHLVLGIAIAPTRAVVQGAGPIAYHRGDMHITNRSTPN